MSAVSCFSEEGEIYTQAFTHDFGQMLNGITSRLSADEDRKNELLKEARALAGCLVFAAKNAVPFSGIELIQKILDGIEKHLDGITDPVALDSSSRAELRSLYLQMSQAVCVIRIRDADNMQSREARDAG